MKSKNIFIILFLFCFSLVFSADYTGKTANIILICGQSNAKGQALQTAINKSLFTGLDTVKYAQAGDSDLSLTLGKTFTLNEFLNSTYPKHGLEISLSEELHKSKMSDVIIIKYAWGGTPINLWRKDNSNVYEGKSNMYNNAINFLKTKMIEFSQLGYSNFTFRGLVWLQGESDAVMTARANVYESQLTKVMSDFKTDLSGIFNISQHEIPLVLVQPAAYSDKTKYEKPEDELKVVNAIKSYVLNTVNTHFIPTNDLTGYVDAIHFNTQSQLEIGKRVADYVLLNNITDVTTVIKNAISVHNFSDGVTIRGASGKVAQFYGISGQLFKSVLINSDLVNIPVNKGFYTISVDSFKSKLLLK